MPPVPKMIYYSIPSVALGVIDRINQETKPVANEIWQPEKITQTGTPATALHSIRSDRRSGEYEQEPCEAEDYSTDRRPEWQKIGARGGRSRPNNRKR